MQHENAPPRARRSAWPLGLAILCCGLCIGTLAEPRGWFDALRARIERRIDPHDRLDPLLRERTVAADALPDNGLVSLSIDIAEDDARRLQDVRDRALHAGVIVQQDTDLVPARLRWAPEGGALGEPLAARLRIKGDWLDHVQTRKWSLRIELAEGALLGMQRFSVQHPGTRGFLWEWLIQQAAAREGLLRPRSTFVNVSINGRSNGVYFLEEHFSKELLESQGRREGPIVRFDESDLWSARLENHIHYMHETPESVRPSDLPQNASIQAFGEKRLSRSDGLARQLIGAVEALAALQRGLAATGDPTAGDRAREHEAVQARVVDELFDIDALARMHALLSLFRGEHGAIWHNMRFYHSPITARLEPILFDSGAGEPRPVKPIPWVRSALQSELNSSTRYYAGVFDELARMLEPDYVHDLFEAIEPDLVRFETALLRDGLPPNRTAEALRATLLEQQELLSASAPLSHELQTSLWVAEGGARAAADELELDLRSNARVPLLIEELRLADGRRLAARDAWQAGASLVSEQGVVLRQNGPPARLRLTRAATDDPLMPGALLGELVFRPLHEPRSRTCELRLGPAPPRAPQRPLQPTLAEALARHACLGYDAQSDRLTLRPGSFDVDGDLIVPAGRVLHASSGTRLAFEPGAVLFSSEALQLTGTPHDPIVLTALDPERGWGGLRVVGAATRSKLEHVALRKAHGTREAGSTAALCFVESSVTLRNLRIDGLAADVAVALTAADLLLVGSAFVDLPGDALHTVSATGLVDLCSFERIAGDALVAVQSSLVLRETRWNAIGGRALVAAAGTTLAVRGIDVDDVESAFVARSGSRIELAGGSLGSLVRRDAAAWTEDAWPPSTIEASGLVHGDRALEALVQHGSSFTLDGARWETVEIAPEALRGEGLLGR